MNLWEDHPDVRAAHVPPAARPGRGRAARASTRSASGTTRRSTSRRAAARPTPHQDHPYWPIKETASVTAWIPFDGSTLASGAMGYLPGSHLIGLRKFVNIFFGEPEDILADPEVARHRAGVRRGARRDRSRSTTASPCTSPKPNTTDRDRARCTRSSTSPTAAPAATRSRTSRRPRLDRGRRGHRQRCDAHRVAVPGG